MEKPTNSSIINICVVPNEPVSAACVSLSQSLRSEDTLFALGDGKFAHMTVYMARFADDIVPNVVDAAGTILVATKPFSCEHTGYFMTAGRYMEASYRKSDAFMALHEALIAAVSQYRINPGQPYEEGYFTPYTAEQRHNAAETGYDLARNLYRPHVTLTRYREGGVPEVFPAFSAAALSFDLGKVCIYRADDNGAVYELIQEFPIA
ncbi:MAG TPA: 2'-5' RNA ligase family protein [Candidatus Saccharimonadales bacterium]|nr:2'-5' RNA ligase family protein [Candidatus Saccharimonadales bacterium]